MQSFLIDGGVTKLLFKICEMVKVLRWQGGQRSWAVASRLSKMVLNAL
jgi:hypothetical protein